MDRGAAHHGPQMRTLLAAPARRRCRRAASAAVCPLRHQHRRTWRAKDIRMSDADNGATPAVRTVAAAAARVLPLAASGWRWLPVAAAHLSPHPLAEGWI